MESTNSDGLEQILILGEAKSSPRNVVYKIQGKCIGGDYRIAMQATNHTDEGTFVTSFTLKALQDYYFEALDLAPTSEIMALQWISEAFGYQSQDFNGLISWQNSASRRLVAKYLVGGSNSLIDLILPPDSFPFVGSLPSKLASDVRASITMSAVRKEIATCRKLAECEKVKVAYTSAMHAALNQSEGQLGLEVVQDILEQLQVEEVADKDKPRESPIKLVKNNSIRNEDEDGDIGVAVREGEGKAQDKASKGQPRRIGAPVIVASKNRKRQQALYRGTEGRTPAKR